MIMLGQDIILKIHILYIRFVWIYIHQLTENEKRKEEAFQSFWGLCWIYAEKMQMYYVYYAAVLYINYREFTSDNYNVFYFFLDATFITDFRETIELLKNCANVCLFE